MCGDLTEFLGDIRCLVARAKGGPANSLTPNGERWSAWERFAFPGRARLNESRRGDKGNWCWSVGRAFVPRDIQQPASCRASVNARPSAGLFQ